MKRIVLLLITLQLITFVAKAQNKLMSTAYVITTNGDSLSGKIPFTTDLELANSVTFIPSGTEKAIVYNPEQLLRFGFDNGRLFKSVELPAGKGRAFAKQVAEGQLNLYRLYQKAPTKQTLFFLERQDTALSISLSPPVRKEVYGSANKSGKHQNLLAYATNRLQNNELPKIGYKEKPIIDYVNEYNQQFESTYKSDVYAELKEVVYQVLGGTAALKLGPDTASDKASFRISFSRNVRNTEKSHTLFSRMGIVYKYAAVQSDLTSFRSNSHSLGIYPLAVQIQAAKGKVRPYAHIGLGAGFFLTSYVDDTDFVPALQINSGVGLKADLGEGALLMEITPSTLDHAGLYFNLGYQF